MKIISASINLSKIDKSKIIVGKNNAQYVNITIIENDEPDQYQNDVSIQQQQTKEEREAKEKKNFIGNGRIVYNADKKQPAPQSDDDTPF